MSSSKAMVKYTGADSEPIIDATPVQQQGPVTIPVEIVEMVAQYLGDDITNVRLTSRAAEKACKQAWGRHVGQTKKLYPTPMSMESWLFLVRDSGIATHVKELHLVGETLRMPPAGYHWAWQDAQRRGVRADSTPTEKDEAIVEFANAVHAHQCRTKTEPFVSSGMYRIMLRELLVLLPGLETVVAHRRLGPDEHVPGWDFGRDLLPLLSDHFENACLKDIFYGGWEYDETYKRVTVFQDEVTGLPCKIQDHIGPQAGFEEDYEAALLQSRSRAEIKVVGECCPGVVGKCCRVVRFRPFPPHVQGLFL